MIHFLEIVAGSILLGVGVLLASFGEPVGAILAAFGLLIAALAAASYGRSK